MQSSMLLPAFMALLASLSFVQATPVPCPEATVDMILNGKMAPDACCNYGICKGDILIKVKAR